MKAYLLSKSLVFLMLNIIISTLENLGIRVEKTIAIGRYAILKIILSSGKEAIAKIPRQCIEDTTSKECEEKSKNLELEMMYLLRIKSRNIVKFVELLDIGLTKILVREYVDSTLRNIIIEKKLPYTKILKIAKEIAIAIDDIHKAGFVYADLKPENIGIGSNEEVVLLDFDSITPPFTKPRFITYSYAPPEYLKDGIVVYESDVYQLALVILEMIFNKQVSGCISIVDSVEDMEFRNLLKSMLSSLPFTRPRLRDVVYKLDMILMSS